MSYDTLLARLHKPRRAALRAGVTRAHRAHCPACQADGGGSPALSVAEGDGGGVLLYCFKGCPVSDVLGAVGMSHEDLFPSSDSQAKGNEDGIGAWVSAAALADLIEYAAGSVVVGQTGGYIMLKIAVKHFHAVAREAMRGRAVA